MQINVLMFFFGLGVHVMSSPLCHLIKEIMEALLTSNFSTKHSTKSVFFIVTWGGRPKRQPNIRPIGKVGIKPTSSSTTKFCA